MLYRRLSNLSYLDTLLQKFLLKVTLLSLLFLLKGKQHRQEIIIRVIESDD